MIILDEVKHDLSTLAPEVKDSGRRWPSPRAASGTRKLTQQSSEPGFFDDQERSRKIFAEMSEIKGKLDKYAELEQLLSDAETSSSWRRRWGTRSLLPEAEEHVAKVKEKLEELRLITLLRGEYDHNNAILTFPRRHGGTEAQDWAQMLYRMYNRWAEAHGYTVEVLDYLDGDEAGIKSASIMVKGTNAYGMLKSENGVHRLVRISPFDANARRQTSFASLEVMPELDDSIKVDIRPEDIEMQVYRSSARAASTSTRPLGGRLIHKPTGIVVSCQTQRSQYQNRDYAYEMLKAKLFQIALQQHKDKIEDIKGVQNEIAWGHQIRSYVFMPYTLVKDHRTGVRDQQC